MEKYLFAFDLDGTLLSPDKTISPANINALKEMHSAGHKIVLASGRLGSSIMEYQDILGIPFSTITLNGAASYLGGAGVDAPVSRKPLLNKYAKHLVKFFNDENKKGSTQFILNFYSGDKLYTDSKNRTSQWRGLYFNETKSKYNFVDDFSTMDNHEPEKILLVGDEQVLDNVEKQFRKKWDSEVYIVRTWNFYLEFLNKKVNKGFALNMLAKKLKIQIENCIAFGDGDNDAELLTNAGIGIAVKNATKKAKAAANKYSKWSNGEDAIAREWELIKG